MSNVSMQIDQALRQAMGLHRQGRVQQAEHIYRQVLNAAPGHPMASHLLAELMVATGRAPEAEQRFRDVLARAPGYVPAKLALARLCAASARLPEGLALAREAAASAPEQFETLACLGWMLDRSRLFDEADATYTKAMAHLPAGAPDLDRVGTLLAEAERYALAAEVLGKAAELAPTSPVPLLRLGAVHERTRAFESALGAFEKARAIDARAVEAHLGIMRILDRLGRDAEAAEAADAALALRPGEPLATSIKAKHLRSAKNHDEAIALLRREIEAHGQQAFAKGMLMIDLGQTFDAAGDYDSAWEAISEGQRQWGSTQRSRRFSAEKFLDWVNRGPAWISAERVHDWTRDPASSTPDPIFFLGFPRSGTTLTEQMLAAHPNLVTTDELPLVREMMEEVRLRVKPGVEYPESLAGLSDAQIDAGRKAYWREVRKFMGESAPGGRRLVDKSPLNTWRLLVIRRFFPRAKVLFALRDPRDVCISCFFQRFNPNPGMVNFQTFAGTVRLYDAVMSAWLKYRDLLGLDVTVTRYEDLVADPEGQARKIIAGVGEPWHDDVLAYREKRADTVISTPSHVAVRQPIYTRSVARWKRYEKHLAPHMDVLQGWVNEFGYA
ncbi:MAG: sulfotransferase [Phycisphaerales bacterium]|nr:sulfotransferase [Phycisphaerales bacterium]